MKVYIVALLMKLTKTSLNTSLKARFHSASQFQNPPTLPKVSKGWFLRFAQKCSETGLSGGVSQMKHFSGN